MKILLVVIGILVLWLIFSFNKFVRLVNRTKEAWADIDIQLKRRHDLIPNLINTVKGYAAHEAGVYQNVTDARSRALTATTPAEKGNAENALSQSLKSIFAIAEAYPDLKANQNFLELQRELEDTENKIQAARRFYNTNLRDLNTALESFPGNFLSKIFGFSKMDFFQLDDAGEREPVEVKF